MGIWEEGGGIHYDQAQLLDLLSLNHVFLYRWKEALIRASLPLVNLLRSQEA